MLATSSSQRHARATFASENSRNKETFMGWPMASVLSAGISAGDPIWFDTRGAVLILTLVLALCAALIFVVGLLARRPTVEVVWRFPGGGHRAAPAPALASHYA
jgi:hypothetical protein